MLRGVQTFLNMYRPEHYSMDQLKERGAEKGSGQHSIPEVENDLRSVRQTLTQFRGQPTEHC